MRKPTNFYGDEKTVAELLSVSVRTVQRWRSSGDGPPFVRAGARRVIYNLAAVETWADARTFAHRAAELSASA